MILAAVLLCRRYWVEFFESLEAIQTPRISGQWFFGSLRVFSTHDIHDDFLDSLHVFTVQNLDGLPCQIKFLYILD